MRLIQPRFLPRKIFDSDLKKKHKSIKSHLKDITGKDLILDFSQARIALFYLLKINLPPNSYIATSCYTIFDIINVIISSGNKPYFIDIDKDNLGPSIKELKINLKKKSIKAIIYTHLQILKTCIGNVERTTVYS